MIRAFFKKRYCFSCGKPISFKEFLKRNRFISFKKKKKLWLSKYIQLYCCGCYWKKTNFKLYIEKPRKERFKCQNQMCNNVQFHLMAFKMLENFRQGRKENIKKHIKYIVVTVLVMVGSLIPFLILFMNI